MTTLPDDQVSIGNNVSISTVHQYTTMPSRIFPRNPQGRLYPPRPTVSLDPRPVVIPILSSVIGFPILVFALICALRHRAIRLRRRDHLKKLHAGGVRSVTLDIPPRDRMSYYSGGSSPEASTRDPLEEAAATPSTGLLKAGGGGLRRSQSASRNNNHVKFVTPAATLEAGHSLQVDVVLHSIERLNGSPWKEPAHRQATIEGGVEVHAEQDDSPR